MAQRRGSNDCPRGLPSQLTAIAWRQGEVRCRGSQPQRERDGADDQQPIGETRRVTSFKVS
jgi:hypothetical protein